jgi:hypothetical protein
VLQHITRTDEAGERFIHQTAASANPETGPLTERLLERMHSDKWMAPLSSLVALSEKAGFKGDPRSGCPGPAAGRAALADRYGIRPDEMAAIRDTTLIALFGFSFWRMSQMDSSF